MERTKIIKLLNTFNNKDYNKRKCIEELQELSLVLLQSLNKPDKNFDNKIIEELGDVEFRLKWLKSLYSKKLIKKRVNHKYKNIKNKYKESC